MSTTRRSDHGSRGIEKADSGTMAPGGPQGCSNNGDDKLASSNVQKAAGGVVAWKPSYLQAQLGNMCCRKERVEDGSAAF